MSDIYSFTVAAAGNSAVPPDGFPENMDYSAVNNAARELMAAIARWRVAGFSGILSAGSSTSYTLVSGQTFAAYTNGMQFAFVAHATSTGPVTLDVDGKGAVAVLDSRGAPLTTGDVQLNGLYLVVKTAASWRLIGGLAAASVQVVAGLRAPLTAGSGNAYTLVAGTIGGAYADGNAILFRADRANTGPATINVDTLGAEALQDPDGAALVANDIVTTAAYLAVRTAGAWRVIAGLPVNLATQVSGVLAVANGGTGQATIGGAAAALAQAGAGFGTFANLASASPDLGLVPSHAVNITGTTAITSFGPTASTTTPVYLVKFAGVLTLTHNATSLIIPGGANYVTSAGDELLAEYLGGGNWRIIAIWPATPIGSLTEDTAPSPTDMFVEARSQSTGARRRVAVRNTSSPRFIQEGTLAAAPTLDMTIPPQCAEMEISLWNWRPATDNVELWMRFSQSGSFLAGASDYAWGSDMGSAPSNDAADAAMNLAVAWGNAANEFLHLKIRLVKPASAAFSKAAIWHGMFVNINGNAVDSIGGGHLLANLNAIDGVRFLCSSGNIASGYYSVRAYSE